VASTRARHAAAGALGVAGAWLAFYAGWLWLAPGGDRGVQVFGDTAYVVPIVAATVLCGWAAARVPRALCGFWILIGLACASWAAGEVLWGVRELGSGSVPFPWWTDAGYLGFYLFALVALVVFFRPSFRHAGSEAVLDGALAVASLALLWWWLVLRDVEIGADLPSLVGLSYPVLDLVLLCIVALTPLVAARRDTLAERPREARRRPPNGSARVPGGTRQRASPSGGRATRSRTSSPQRTGCWRPRSGSEATRPVGPRPTCSSRAIPSV
jgi:hypothetical protein